MWSVIVLAALSAHSSPPSTAIESAAGYQAATFTDGPRITGTSRSAESTNFQIHCHVGCCDARKMAECCEAWRGHLRDKWQNLQDDKPWTPRCVVVVHATRNSYLAAVGRGGERSFGSTWIDSKEDRVSQRRIDLLTNPRGQITALGHELTHVVLADAFGCKQPPPWANEGIALLADSTDKQARHEQDARQAINSRTAFRCLELMTMDRYPSPDRIPAFYGQSALLVRMLAQRGEPHEFLDFLQQSQKLGLERALSQTYGIVGSSELERLWGEYLAELPASSTRKQLAANLGN